MQEGMKKMIGGRQIILGTKDRLVAFSEIENIKEYLRLSLTQSIEASHMIMEDEPLELATKIENLVKTFSKK
jgi:carboxypeptidase C (cathepsin A)